MANLGYIQVCRICNQKCLFCSNPDNERVLGLAEAKEQIDSLVNQGYTGVILTGGEPTLHPQLDEIVAYAEKRNIHARIITNGQKTADRELLQRLVEAGLEHLHLSVHSTRKNLQSEITGNPESLKNVNRTAVNARDLELTCDINTVICAQNADHLDQTVGEMFTAFPFIRHFVFNNLDSRMNRVVENPQSVAKLRDFELALYRATRFLEEHNCTYRIERVPLCYMTEFAHASTETRKIVKQEERTVHFLDEKGEIHQVEFFHEKAKVCKSCSLNEICAGLYDMDGAYSSKELYPVFVDPQIIINRIKSD